MAVKITTHTLDKGAYYQTYKGRRVEIVRRDDGVWAFYEEKGDNLLCYELASTWTIATKLSSVYLEEQYQKFGPVY